MRFSRNMTVVDSKPSEALLVLQRDGGVVVAGGMPSRWRMLGILDLNFAVVLPAHGEPVLADATRLYRPAIEAAVPG